jgi:hypothetical protein
MAVTDARTATDTRHRVPYPNSRPRRVALVGLGHEGARLAATLDRTRLPHVDVIELPRIASTPDTLLGAIAERSGDLASAFKGADMIYLVCGPDDDVGFAAPIAQIAHYRGVLVTGVLIYREAAQPGVGDANLNALRRACDMLVIAADDDYLAALLAALGT